MTSAPTLQPTFLPTRNQLGVVAVGFSGGQVSSTFAAYQKVEPIDTPMIVQTWS
jgi:hypothetical protein